MIPPDLHYDILYLVRVKIITKRYLHINSDGFMVKYNINE